MDEKNRKKQLEDSLKESLERASKSSKDGKDYLAYVEASTKLSSSIDDYEKLESDKKEKKNGLIKKILLAIVPACIVEILRFIFLERHTKRVIAFEKDGMWTTSAGKNIGNSTKFK